MPVNAGPEYAAAEAEYSKAKTPQDKIKALERMYSLAPKHKSSEGLLREIKTKIVKITPDFFINLPPLSLFLS